MVKVIVLFLSPLSAPIIHHSSSIIHHSTFCINIKVNITITTIHESMSQSWNTVEIPSNQTWREGPQHHCKPKATCEDTQIDHPNPKCWKWYQFCANWWFFPWNWHPKFECNLHWNCLPRISPSSWFYPLDCLPPCRPTIWIENHFDCPMDCVGWMGWDGMGLEECIVEKQA